MSNRDLNKIYSVQSSDYSIEFEFWQSQNLPDPDYNGYYSFHGECYDPHGLTKMIDETYCYNSEIKYYSDDTKPLSLTFIRYIYKQITAIILDSIAQFLADERNQLTIDSLLALEIVDRSIKEFDRDYEYPMMEVY